MFRAKYGTATGTLYSQSAVELVGELEIEALEKEGHVPFLDFHLFAANETSHFGYGQVNHGITPFEKSMAATAQHAYGAVCITAYGYSV
jgi:hypothetical protein